jgi:hypothetical protein
LESRGKAEALAESTLTNEQLLEKMILAAPQMLSDEWSEVGARFRKASRD